MFRFGPPNINKLRAKRDVMGLIKAISYKKDLNVRKEAICTLGEIREKQAVVPLLGQLKDSHWDLREAAANALGQIGDSNASEGLCAALKDAHSEVRQAAVDALGKCGVPNDPIIQACYAVAKEDWDLATSLGTYAVDPLCAALKDIGAARWQSGVNIIRALGKIGDTRAIEALCLALGKSHGELTIAAKAALARIGPPAVPALCLSLKDSYWVVCNNAASVLGKIGDARAAGPLCAALEETHYLEQEKCSAFVEALGRIGHAVAVEPLCAGLRTPHFLETTKHQTIRALVNIGAPAVASLCELLRDESLELRFVAAKALGEIGDARALEPLVAALAESDGSSSFAEALGQIGDARAVGPLCEVLKGKHKLKMWAAAEALGQIGDAQAVEPLCEALKESDTMVVSAAAKALGRIGNARAIESLEATLKGSIPSYTRRDVEESLALLKK